MVAAAMDRHARLIAQIHPVPIDLMLFLPRTLRENAFLPIVVRVRPHDAGRRHGKR